LATGREVSTRGSSRGPRQERTCTQGLRPCAHCGARAHDQWIAEAVSPPPGSTGIARTPVDRLVSVSRYP